MSEVNMAVIKPEMMKSYIWLQTADGSIQQVEQEAAMFCPMICHEVIQKGMGSSKSYAISLPQRVNPASLSLILDYCRFHQVPGRSNKECKSFDEKFIRMETKRLCELTSAADSLQLKPLVDLTSRALARIIEGRSPEEIREIFHLPDDLTEEEKLEPLKNTTDDPRIRLLNRLYAKKRKELKERDKLKIVEVEEDHVDDRSVDDLLSFINGGDSKGIRMSKNKKKHRRRKDQQKSASGDETIKTDEQEEKLEPLNNTTGNPRIRLLNRMYAKKRKELKERDKLKIVEVEEDHVDDRSVDDLLSFINGDSKGIRMSKNKKKHRRRKDQQKSASGDETIKTAEQESNGLNSLCHCAEVGNELRPDQGETSNMQYIEDDFFARKSEPDDGDVDDEIDPALKEKIDREVEDFARRLNSDWPERMQEILSLGQEIRPIYYSANGNGRRYAKNQIGSRNDVTPDWPHGWNNFGQMLMQVV